MHEKVASLSTEQAQRALLLFYDLLPAGSWQDGKPSEARVEALTDELREDGPPEAQALLAKLDESDDPRIAAEVARVLLNQFADQPATRPYVETAVERAGEPHLMLIETVVLIGVLAVLSGIDYDKPPFAFKGQRVVELVKALPSSLGLSLGGSGAAAPGEGT